jgi:hypothetical protein
VAFILQALTSSVKTAKYLSAVPEAADRCRKAMQAVLADHDGHPTDGRPPLTRVTG